MKKLHTTVLLTMSMLLLLFATSCKDEDVYTNFQTEYSFKVTIPANTTLNLPIELFSTEEEANFQEQYALNDTRKDLIEDVFLNEFWVEVTEPQGQDLSFLQSAHFYIDATEEPEALVASKDPVPASVGDELSFDVEGTNMASYIKSDAFDIRANVVTEEQRTEDIILLGRATFDVRAKVIDL